MKTEKEVRIKWYKCKRDLGLTAFVLLLFGIAILHFDIYENFRKSVWVAFKIKSGIFPNMLVDIFFEWGMWMPTLAVLVVSIFVCLRHYWPWIVITFLGVSFFLTIYSSNNLEGTKQITDILISEFSNISSIAHFMGGVSTYVIISSPYVAITSAVLFLTRKKAKC